MQRVEGYLQEARARIERLIPQKVDSLEEFIGVLKRENSTVVQATIKPNLAVIPIGSPTGPLVVQDEYCSITYTTTTRNGRKVVFNEAYCTGKPVRGIGLADQEKAYLLKAIRTADNRLVFMEQKKPGLETNIRYRNLALTRQAREDAVRNAWMAGLDIFPAKLAKKTSNRTA